jgi:hypothetical protein
VKRIAQKLLNLAAEALTREAVRSPARTADPLSEGDPLVTPPLQLRKLQLRVSLLPQLGTAGIRGNQQLVTLETQFAHALLIPSRGNLGYGAVLRQSLGRLLKLSPQRVDAPTCLLGPAFSFCLLPGLSDGPLTGLLSLTATAFVFTAFLFLTAQFLLAALLLLALEFVPSMLLLLLAEFFLPTELLLSLEFLKLTLLLLPTLLFPSMLLLLPMSLSLPTKLVLQTFLFGGPSSPCGFGSRCYAADLALQVMLHCCDDPRDLPLLRAARRRLVLSPRSGLSPALRGSGCLRGGWLLLHSRG